MTITNVEKDPVALTMTVTSEFDAPVDRVWRLWEDPRQLEKWWGPPTYPATFTAHDLRPGGRCEYHMTGPDGDQPKGWWEIVAVDAPHKLELRDGFADEHGEPSPDMPVMTMRLTIEEVPGGGSRMTIETTFPSQEAMEQLTAMGMDEGMREALGQIDALLAA
jgi:uncharacterized protein YndB with AHSA1/START domain